MRQSAQSARKPETPREPGPRPSHRVYQVTGNGDDAFWREIEPHGPTKTGMV